MRTYYRVAETKFPATLAGLTEAHRDAREYAQCGPVEIVKIQDGKVVWSKTVPRMPHENKRRKGYEGVDDA